MRRIMMMCLVKFVALAGTAGAANMVSPDIY
jgi:hypothetical protein